MPFMKCSAQEVSSPSVMMGAGFVPSFEKGTEEIVPYGSRYKLMIGSAKNPATNMARKKMVNVRATCVTLLLTHLPQAIRSRR